MSLGAGEYIIRSELARSIGGAWDAAGEDADMHEILQRVLVDQFWCESLSCNMKRWIAMDSSKHCHEIEENQTRMLASYC